MRQRGAGACGIARLIWPVSRPGFAELRSAPLDVDQLESVARVVFERDAQPDPESRHRAVLDRDVLSEHLGDSEVAHASRGCLYRVASGGLPRLTAYTDHLGHAVHAVCHAVLLIVGGGRWSERYRADISGIKKSTGTRRDELA